MAILAMVVLHLFCRNSNLPYTTFISLNGVPLLYYFGLFGDICVPIYCFISGYAQMLLYQKNGKSFLRKSVKRLNKFYINYLVVVLLFSGIGLIIGSSTVPGSLTKFLGNVFLVGMSYNGAWWFVLTYIFLVLLSPLFAKAVNKLPPILTVILSGIIYCIAYFFRMIHPLTLPGTILPWIFNQIILIGTSQFSFVIGMICFRFNVISKIKEFLLKKRLLIPVCVIVPIFMFISHIVVQSMAVAPITGISVLICFYIFPLHNAVKKFFLFFGKHSTNIWLVHMFFYSQLFENLVFKAQYPVLIFPFMIVLSLLSSYVINFILSLINKIPTHKKA